MINKRLSMDRCVRKQTEQQMVGLIADVYENRPTAVFERQMFLKTDGVAAVFGADVFERQTVYRLAPRLTNSFVCVSSRLYTTTGIPYGPSKQFFKIFFLPLPLGQPGH